MPVQVPLKGRPRRIAQKRDNISIIVADGIEVIDIRVLRIGEIVITLVPGILLSDALDY